MERKTVHVLIMSLVLYKQHKFLAYVCHSYQEFHFCGASEAKRHLRIFLFVRLSEFHGLLLLTSNMLENSHMTFIPHMHISMLFCWSTSYAFPY